MIKSPAVTSPPDGLAKHLAKHSRKSRTQLHRHYCRIRGELSGHMFVSPRKACLKMSKAADITIIPFYTDEEWPGLSPWILSERQT
jgi:hypothetical protein